MPAAEDGESRKKRARARPLGFVEIKIGATGCIVPTLRNPRRVGQPVMYFSPEDRTGQPPIMDRRWPILCAIRKSLP